MSHDNPKHALDFHRVNVAAITAFLLLDVQNPPPRLLIQDPKAYRGMIRHDGAQAMCSYYFRGGFAVIRWQYSIRSASGRTITHCLAYAFHAHRALAYKTKSVYIALTALLGLVCAHPKLVQVLEATCCMSFLGRIYIAFDRFIEYVNLLQQKRGTAFRGYDSQLHFTQYLKPLVHVDAAWKEAEGISTGMDDGIAEYLYNDISEMRRKLREAIGSDLTKPSGNTLWFTGNAVPIDGGDYRERKPDVYQDAVAEGRSVGCGRATRVSWRNFLRDFIEEHTFHM